MTRPRLMVPLVLGGAACLLAACSASGSVTEAAATSSPPVAGSSSSTGGAAAATTATETASAPDTGAASEASSSQSASTSSTIGSGASDSVPEADPCSLLDPAIVQQVLGVEVDAGVEDRDEARQVRMCTWQRSDPVTIVVTGVTSVGADEAYQTNKDLAPAYFDGDAVEKPVAGTDRAYVVKSGDTGYVVGFVARGRYVSVQVATEGVTEQQAVSLAETAAAALP